MIFLFTDFGADDLYVGQVRAVLLAAAPAVPAVDLLHRVPPFDIAAGAHLLAALAGRLPVGSVCLAVVDPGVGGTRHPVVLEADGRWFVGPDNGLLSVLAQRAARQRVWRIVWQPEALSATFHGRDLFAPIAAAVARGPFPEDRLAPCPALEVQLPADNLARVIYVDHYGNCLTGLRACALSTDHDIEIAGTRLPYAPTFCAAEPGALLWLENSLGLVEIAANGASAAAQLGVGVGTPVAVKARPR